MQTIVYFEMAYPEETARARQWRKLAKELGVEIVEDPAVVEARKQRQLAAAMAEFLGE